MPKFPSLSSKQLVQLLQNHGAVFKRHGRGDHAIYERIVAGKRYAAPIIHGKKTLSPIYVKQVLRQLGFTQEEIDQLTK